MSEENKPKKKRINWTTDKIMSTSALFISVISLIALLYQSYLAREENKLIQKQQSANVLPHLSQWFSNSSKGYKIVYGNNGVGPAFIKRINFILNDSLSFHNSDKMFRYIFKNSSKLDSISYSNNTLYEGFVLPAEKNIEIIIVNSKNGIKFFKDYLSKNEIKFNLIYEDIYGTQWKIMSTKNTTGNPVLINTEN